MTFNPHHFMEIKEFEAEPVVPAGIAASMLQVSAKRIYQLLQAGRLERGQFDGAVGVTLASIKRRQRWKQRAKKSSGSPHS